MLNVKACICLLLPLGVVFLPAMHAQQFEIESIRIKAGLPTDNIYKAAKNEKGFLYFATRRGLCKYDGYHFYKNKDIGANIASVTAGKNNIIYYYDLSLGLCSITDIADTPTVISPADYTDADPNNDHYESLYVDKAQRIWSADFTQVKYHTANHSDSGFYTIDKDGKDLKNISFIELPNGNILVATSTGLFNWDISTHQLQPFTDSTISKQSYLSGTLLGSNTLFLSTTDGEIVSYNISKKTIESQNKPLALRQNDVREITAFDNNNILIAYSNSLYQYNIKKNEYKLVCNTEGSIPNSIYYDRENSIIWLNTNKGILKIQKKKELIEVVQLPKKTSPSSKIVQSIIQDSSGTIWLATEDAIFNYKKEKGWHSMFLPPSIICNNLYEHKDILYACTNKGLYIFNEKKIEKLDFTYNNEDVKKIAVDNNSRLWLLLNNSTVTIINNANVQEKSIVINNDPSFWKDNKWNDIICDKAGNIWLAGWVPPGYGIARYNFNAQKFIEASSFPSNANHEVFIGDYFNRVNWGINKSLLFSGYGGFNIIDSTGTVTKGIGTKEYAITSEIIQGISQTADGKVWFATAEGLNVWDNRLDKIFRISQADGLPTDELTYGFCQLSNSQLALGYENGLILIDQEKILEPSFSNKLALSSVEINGEMRSATKNIFVLSYKENNIKISFSSLSYIEKEKQIYRYKTDEDDNWTYLNELPEISLSHIAPGTYNITVEVGNTMGSWQNEKLLFYLIIRPPFYQTYWFRFIIIVLIAAVIFFTYQYLLKQQKNRERIKRKLKEAQMQALRTQMNPHFIFNSLNSINSFILDKKTDEASEYLTTFSRLMRTTLELTRKDVVRLSQEMEALRLYLEIESTRLEQGFDYSIKVEENVDTESITIPPLILQPFVENAIWHGLRNKHTGGNINIVIEMKNSEVLHVKIEDDGIGRKKSASLKKSFKEHKSYGMEITFNRLQLHHSSNQLTIDDIENDGIATGTVVHLYIHI